MPKALANIFEDHPENDGGERGPDLHVNVRVARSTLRAGRPVVVSVPDVFVVDGRTATRARSPHDDPGTVTLNLPANLPDEATIRLRGQGGRLGDEPPGDLFVTVAVDDGGALARLPAGGVTRTSAGVGMGLLSALIILFVVIRGCG